ncbi:hypothetical protein GCM10020331_072390 [Ectobacillus funiculus]
MMLNYYSIEKKYGNRKKSEVRHLKIFEKSEYAKGTYFEKYEVTDFRPRLDKVKKTV